MRIVIVGGGGTGAELAGMMLRSGEDEVAIVESDAARCEELAGELDVLVLHGDGTHPDMLQKAGLGEGAALAATTGSDAINTVIALLGHRLGAKRIVVRLDGVGLRPACREIGVTDIVSPRLASAARMLASMRGLRQLDLSLLARGGLRLAELSVGHWAGTKLDEHPLPKGCLAVALVRGDSVVLAEPAAGLQEGDTLLALSEGDEASERLRKAAAPPD